MDNTEGIYRAILDSVTDGVYYCDTDRVITYWNAGAERITGYSAEQVLGTSCAHGLLIHVDERGTDLCRLGCPISATLTDGRPREERVYLNHQAGHRVPVLVRTTPVLSPDGTVAGVIETFSDNSALLDALRQVDKLSLETETDHLTEVGNRRSMMAKLSSAVKEARRTRGSTGLLFIDIDHFKLVNDTYGHDAGDRVLRMVAKTIKHNLRATDSLARWGGEEFLALVNSVDLAGLKNTAEKLRVLVASSQLKVEETVVRVTISIGATLVRPDDTRDSLVARADALLYRSKAEGRDRYTLEP